MKNEKTREKVIIIGSGPAGLTAAIYAARGNLEPLVLAGSQWGGQLMNTTEVENFPGFVEGIMGPELMDNMLKQATRFGAKFVYENVTQIEKLEEGHFVVSTYDKKFEAESVILATGATPRKLGIDGEDKFYGKGVSTCATCDAPFYRNKVVAVIGGGDSAMEEASFLSKFVSKLYLIHRRDEFRASKIMQERVINNPKIEILYSTDVLKVNGEDKVASLTLKNNKTNQESDLVVNGMFLAIGHIPVTDFVKGEIELDEQGYVKSKDGVHTSIEGFFVAGDVQDAIYRQAITASGAGCAAALIAERWLIEKAMD